MSDFTTNAEMVDYINARLPECLNVEGKGKIRAYVWHGLGDCISLDFWADPRGLQGISHNNKMRAGFLMHSTPERPRERSPLKFEYVSGMYNCLMAEMGIKRPALRKQKTFKAAADKIIEYFVKHQEVFAKHCIDGVK